MPRNVLSNLSLLEEDSAAPDFPSTDLGNAERLAVRHGADLHYSHEWRRWWIWTGTRWQPDLTGEIMRCAAETARSIRDMEWALASESQSHLFAMVKIAQSRAGIPITTAQLDADPFLLNCANGTLNLHSGELRPHRREDLLTKQLAVPYVQDAQCPHWEAFLRHIFSDNEDLISFLQRAVGYSLTGVVAEHVLFFLYGRGQNGKSTFTETLAALLGDYFQKAPANLLMGKISAAPGRASPEVARLFGARMVVAAEVDQGQRLNEAQVKDLTGSDIISARHLYKENVDFKPSHKLWVYGNHKPVIRGTDDGIWRRIKVIPFTVQIANPDPFFRDKYLLPELTGILAWAVRGCLAWRQQGLSVPREITEATAVYRAEMTHVRAFIDECCIIASHLIAPYQALYAAYAEWCRPRRDAPLGEGAFRLALDELGFPSRKGTKGARFRQGLTLVTDGVATGGSVSTTGNSAADDNESTDF